ncbi:ABC transporter permease [Pseudarthrobacter sp. H2]|uniref:ABC transporter permease n=1 Tax=Pseudarthrobacter sp. H2 TaxID=3418415 RepID=UPI003CEB5CAC
MSQTDFATEDPGSVPPATVAKSPSELSEKSKWARGVRQRKLKSTLLVLGGQVVLVAIVLGFWEWLAVSGTVNPLFIGQPTKIFQQLLVQLATPAIWVDASSTVGGWFFGWVLASIVAIVFAFIVTRSAHVRNIIEPITVAINGLPRVAFAPLFVLWFGIGLTSKIAMSFSIAFFVVFANTLAAVDGVDRDQALLAKVIGATERQAFRKFILPGAIPTIFAGLELAAIFAMLGTVAGELLAGSEGLGVKLALYGSQFQTNDYFATLTILGVLSLLITQILRAIRRRALHWQTLDAAAR